PLRPSRDGPLARDCGGRRGRARRRVAGLVPSRARGRRGARARLRSRRGSGKAAEREHDDYHGVGAGCLLLAPIAALLLVAPPTLGSYGLGRAATVKIRSGEGAFRPLSESTTARQMSLTEFSQRAYERDGASFNGRPVELTGFVAGPEAGGFKLARYQIACCAADAAPVVVRIVGISG